MCIKGLYPSLLAGLTKFNTFMSYPFFFKYPAVLSYNSPFGSVNIYDPSIWYAFGIEYDADLPEPEPSNYQYVNISSFIYWQVIILG